MRSEKIFELFIQSFIKLSHSDGLRFAIFVNNKKDIELLGLKIQMNYNLRPCYITKNLLQYQIDNKLLTIVHFEQATYRGRVDFALCDYNISNTIKSEILRPICNLSFELTSINFNELLENTEVIE